MAKLVFILLLVIVLTGIHHHQSNAQGNSDEYIVKDSIYSMGEVTQLGKGRIRFQKTKREQAVIYSALDIKEYGYNGKVYEALLVSGRLKFVRRIVSGKVNLYRDKRLYVLRVDTSLTVFNKRNYRSVVGESVNCEGKERSLSMVSYSRISLRNYLEEYNNGNCELENFAHRNSGGYVGYNFLQVNAVFEGSMALRDYASAPSAGLFIDLPLHNPRSLFASAELNWFSGRPVFYGEDQNMTSYAGINVNGISVLLNGKWSVARSNLRTYFKAGGLLSWVSISSSAGLIRTYVNGSVVDIARQEILDSSTLLCGFNSGVGFEIPYKGRKNFQLELGYMKTFDGNFDSMSMNISRFSIVGGFNF